MSNIKDVRCKSRLHDLVDLLAGVWPPYCVTLSSLSSGTHATMTHAASYVDHEKRVAWVSNPIDACGFVPIVMVLLNFLHRESVGGWGALR